MFCLLFNKNKIFKNLFVPQYNEIQILYCLKKFSLSYLNLFYILINLKNIKSHSYFIQLYLFYTLNFLAIIRTFNKLSNSQAIFLYEYIIYSSIFQILMKSQDQKQRQEQLSLGSTQSFWSIWKKIKNSIFDALFVILDNSDNQQSMVGLISETGLDYIQMMTFPFSSTVIAVWTTNSTLVGFSNFINNFSIVSFIPGIQFNSFLVLMYSLIFVILLVLIDICYVVYSFSKKRFMFTFPLTLMAKCVPIFVTVLFLSIMETLLQIINCQDNEDGDGQVLQFFPNVVCWEGWHLFHTTICLIFAFIYVVISCLVALALFEPRMTTNRLTARQNSSGEVIFIINKIICQLIFSFTPFSDTLIYCILLFVMSAWLFYAYNIAAQPYYNKNTSKFFRICTSYYFWTNLMLLISQLLNSVGFQDGLVIWLCGVMFIGITIAFERKSNIDTLFSSSLKFKTGQELESHLKYVLQLHHSRNQDKNSYMLLLGYIEKHIELCLEEDCPLIYNKEKFMTGKQEQQHSCNQLLKQIERMFIYGIKKYPQCTKLRLSFAFFYLQNYENKVKAYQHFLRALQTEPSFGEQFIIYRFTKIISQHLEVEKQNKQEDLIQIIKFDNHISLCSEGMLLSSKLHRQFWIQLKQESPNLKRLNLIGASIIQTSEIIKQNYREVLKLSGDNISVVELQYNYALYLLLICHQHVESKNLMEKVKRKERQHKKKCIKELKDIRQSKIEEMLNTKKGLVICEIDKQADKQLIYCKIKKVNKQMLELTKYSQEQLVNKRLEKILPKYIQHLHGKKIEQFFGKLAIKQQTLPSSVFPDTNNFDQSNEMIQAKNYVGEQQTGFIRQSTGFIKRVKYLVLYAALQNKFIAQVRACPGQATILCDTDGIITQYSRFARFYLPNHVSMLSIEDLLGMGLVEHLKSIQKKELAVQISTLQSNFHIQLNLLELQISNQRTKKTETNSPNIDHLFISQAYLQPRAVGIVATITVLNNQNNINFSNRFKNRTSGGFDWKNVSLMPNITTSIQKSYTDSRNLASIQQKNEYASNKSPFNFEGTTKTQHFINKFHEIKTYRYHQQKFTRIYLDDLLVEESDFDCEQKIADLEAKLSRQKIQDVNYQLRIRKALNTFIWHSENEVLFIVGCTTFTLLLALLFLMQSNFKAHSAILDTHLTQFKHNLNDVQLITSGLLQALFTDDLTNQTYTQLINHRILFSAINSSVLYNFMLEDNATFKKMDISNCLIRIQANLARFYESRNNTTPPSSRSLDLLNVYYSYLQFTVSGLSDNFPKAYQNPSSKQIEINKIYLGIIVLLMTWFTLMWAYFELKLKFKINEVLLWFLDIPFGYINFASKQCIQFTKSTLRLEKSEEIALSQKKQFQSLEFQQLIDEYKTSHSMSQNSFEGQEKPESYKNRQLLISRYRKKRQLSSVNFKQMLKFVSIFALAAAAFLLLTFQQQMVTEWNIVRMVFNAYMRQYTWISAMPMILKIAAMRSVSNQSFHQQLNGWLLFKQIQIYDLTNQAISNSLDSSKYVENIMEQIFTETIPSKYSWVVNKTVNFQYSNICKNAQNYKENSTLTQKQLQQCGNLLKNRLQGGYSILKEYIKQLKQSFYNLQPQQYSAYSLRISKQLCEFQESLRLYASPLLFSILQDLLKSQIQSASSSKQKLLIVLYANIACMIMLFTIPWHLYLRRLNNQVNQTIQILNVVPMGLIPVGRKETRDFIKWIIKKASQVEADSGIDSENQKN